MLSNLSKVTRGSATASDNGLVFRLQPERFVRAYGKLGDIVKDESSIDDRKLRLLAQPLWTQRKSLKVNLGNILDCLKAFKRIDLKRQTIPKTIVDFMNKAAQDLLRAINWLIKNTPYENYKDEPLIFNFDKHLAITTAYNPRSSIWQYGLVKDKLYAKGEEQSFKDTFYLTLDDTKRLKSIAFATFVQRGDAEAIRIVRIIGNQLDKVEYLIRVTNTVTEEEKNKTIELSVIA